jgi:hypothetical protein
LPSRLPTHPAAGIGLAALRPEAQALLEGKSAGRVSGVNAALCDAGPDGVVMNASGWLVTAQR